MRILLKTLFTVLAIITLLSVLCLTSCPKPTDTEEIKQREDTPDKSKQPGEESPLLDPNM